MYIDSFFSVHSIQGETCSFLGRIHRNEKGNINEFILMSLARHNQFALNGSIFMVACRYHMMCKAHKDESFYIFFSMFHIRSMESFV